MQSNAAIRTPDQYVGAHANSQTDITRGADIFPRERAVGYSCRRAEDGPSESAAAAKRGRVVDAEVEYKAALRLSPQYAPAAANLAELYRRLGRETDAEAVLRAGLAASPQDAGLHYALGLTLVRFKRIHGTW